MRNPFRRSRSQEDLAAQPELLLELSAEIERLTPEMTLSSRMGTDLEAPLLDVYTRFYRIGGGVLSLARSVITRGSLEDPDLAKTWKVKAYEQPSEKLGNYMVGASNDIRITLTLPSRATWERLERLDQYSKTARKIGLEQPPATAFAGKIESRALVTPGMPFGIAIPGQEVYDAATGYLASNNLLELGQKLQTARELRLGDAYREASDEAITEGMKTIKTQLAVAQVLSAELAHATLTELQSIVPEDGVDHHLLLVPRES